MDTAFLKEKLDHYEESLKRLDRGEITPEEFKRVRLWMGIYAQRQEGFYMVRCKVPYGEVTGEQLRAVAGAIEKYGRGVTHISTRQNIQTHFVNLNDTIRMMRELFAAGLTTREACGHTVRNVVGCHLAGVCPDEEFDIRPYAKSVFEDLLGNPICQSLPRKFKITLSGCGRDCVQSAVNDIGLVAVSRHADGERQEGFTPVRGFKVYVGGGQGAVPQVGAVLSEFLPVEELLPACEAILKLFDREGNRKDLKRARMKFLLKAWGIEKFSSAVGKELGRTLNGRGSRCPTQTHYFPREAPGDQSPYDEWRFWNVLPQKQAGFNVVSVALPLGNISSSQLRRVADVAERYGDGGAQTTIEQNLALKWIRDESLPEVYESLLEVGLAEVMAERAEDVVACPGLGSCSLAVTHAPETAVRISERLRESNGNLRALGRVRIKLSGCHNSCGHHHVADVGLFGCVGVGPEGRSPHYQLLVGGGTNGRPRLGRRIRLRVSDTDAPLVVSRVLEYYLKEREPSEPFKEFVERVGPRAIREYLESN